MVATAALTSFGTTSPLYIKQQAMYFPCLGYGTKLVWNSVTSTLRAPSNLKEAVKDEIVWEINLFRLVYVGLSMSNCLLQMS